jgi:hypothetical protein
LPELTFINSSLYYNDTLFETKTEAHERKRDKMASKEEIKLIEKISRTKMKLESMLRQHSANCMLELDPDYYGPCTCGANEHNRGIQAAIKELSLN